MAHSTIQNQPINRQEAVAISRAVLDCPSWIGSFENQVSIFSTQFVEEVVSEEVLIALSSRQPFGKKMESIVGAYLKQDAGISAVQTNLQVKGTKETLGEFDFVFVKEHQLHHAELATKFYLWDSTLSNNPLECWIGPNRKDFLHLKLSKLKNHQFRLPFTKEGKKKLSNLFDTQRVDYLKQAVILKAHVFSPLHGAEKIDWEGVNKNCLKGVFTRADKLADEFTDWQFTLPEKLFWMCEPQEITRFEYREMEAFTAVSMEIMENKRSQLVWLKNENQYLRVFATFW